MNYQDLRISKLREYLISIISSLTNDNKYQINANMLSNNINNYSLDKIPISSVQEEWILDVSINRDVYSFRSRNNYSQDTIDNLLNVGFFEKFEKIINSNNNEGILPDIEGIESIECLNCGTMRNAEAKTSEFDIQIQITYREDKEREALSLWKK